VVVRQYDGEPRGLDGQALRWCTQEELDDVQLLPADGPIVRAPALPGEAAGTGRPLYAISETAAGAALDRCQGVANEGPLRAGVLHRS